MSTQVLVNLLQVLKELDGGNGDLAPSPTFNDEPPLAAFFSKIGGKEPEWCGAVGLDPVSTQIRAIGESLERYCIANWNENKTILSTASTIPNAVPLERFVNQQIVEESYGRRLCTNSDEIHWYPVNTWKNESLYVPNQVATYGGGDEPFVWDSNTNGLACHGSEELARFSGLGELIERDAFFIRYHAKIKAPQVNISSNSELTELIQLFDRYRLDVEVYDLDLGFGLPVYMTVLLDRTKLAPHIALGFGTNTSGVEAIRKSMFEAAQIRTYHRSLEEDAGKRGMSQIDARAILYNKATKKALAHMLDDSGQLVEIKDLNAPLSEFISSFPHDLYFADLTLPGMAGFWVVKAICPDLVNLYFDDRASPLKNERLLEAAGDEPLHTISHPFA